MEDKVQQLLLSSTDSTSEEGESGNAFAQQLIGRSERKKIINSITEAIKFEIKLPAMLSFEDTLEG